MNDIWFNGLVAAVTGISTGISGWYLGSRWARSAERLADAGAQTAMSTGWSKFADALEKRLARTEGRLDECEKKHDDCEKRSDRLEQEIEQIKGTVTEIAGGKP